ncbi:hypothetical protein HGB47_14875 [Leptospira yasudae]|uniref:hypothetical protein n=1 Tax=Leptospira yasudae TaxID=2202201 RepID=UPI001C50249A|nr:hypothetical protein [Leptospira yasudae]MBW0434900.1 hypothetical protein [Leptospira yasudae]
MDDLVYQQYIESFDKIPKITLKNIEASMLDLSKSEYLELVNREEDGIELKIDSNGVAIKLKQAAFIDNINIIIPESENSKELTVSFRPLYGYNGLSEAKYLHEEKSEIISYSISTLVNEIIIKHKKWLFLLDGNQPVRKIILKGILASDLSNLSAAIKQCLNFQDGFLSSIEKEKSELAKKNAEVSKREVEFKEKQDKFNVEIAAKEAEFTNQKAAVDSQISAKQAEVNILNDQLTKITKSSEDLKLNVTNLNKQVDEARNALKEAKDKENLSVAEHKKKLLEIQELERTISRNKEELIRLSQDKSLFTEDIKGHFQEGFKQIRLYTVIIFLPIISAIVMGVGIYLNSDKVTNLLIEHPDIGIFRILASRMPYTTISLALIAFFSTITSIFIKRMIEIHKSRLRFSEIGILTKDASDSFISGQNLTDSQKQEFRLGMRMKMLREYISGKFDLQSKDEDLLSFLSIKKKLKTPTQDSSEG